LDIARHARRAPAGGGRVFRALPRVSHRHAGAVLRAQRRGRGCGHHRRIRVRKPLHAPPGPAPPRRRPPPRGPRRAPPRRAAPHGRAGHGDRFARLGEPGACVSGVGWRYQGRPHLSYRPWLRVHRRKIAAARRAHPPRTGVRRSSELSASAAMTDSITIAVSKGRIFNEALPLLRAAGIEPVDDPDTSRKLILDTNLPDVKLVLIRASDVPTYVEYGAADVGIAGKDVLLEYEGDGLYGPRGREIARCRLMLAGPPNLPAGQTRLRIATKYVNCTRRYFAEQGKQVEIIKLYGSMELAPIVGLADLIVDLVDTGNTLKANGLAPLEHIADVSSQLIVNKASMKMKHARVNAFVRSLAAAVELRRARA